MKNLLFGVCTLGVLFGLAYIAISPGLTELLVNDTQSNLPAKAINQDQILQATGKDWNGYSAHQKVKFVLRLSYGLESEDLAVPEPNHLIQQLDAYYEKNPKSNKIEQAVMTILTESWKSNEKEGNL